MCPENDKTNECIEKKRQEVKCDDDTEKSIYLPAHLPLVFPSVVTEKRMTGTHSRGKLCVGRRDIFDVLLVPWLPLGACAAS